ncbi:sugar transferase, partial [Armatimonas sp.]|uniref:sugar transferase n=1 Tax=Armatimonas sp. TaxID=1872638 RepID=UPI00286CA332
MKRFADFIAALIGLLLSGPLWLVIALFVRLDSPGPVLFRQRRVGRGGKEFVLLKFRSMRTDTPNLPTAALIASGLEPYTPVGKWLRKTSLDELPQLWNVLVGEMSLVGPRPALPSQTELNAQREALGVQALRPGITGWAQVNGRDNLSDAEKVARDAEYLQRQSLLLDG